MGGLGGVRGGHGIARLIQEVMNPREYAPRSMRTQECACACANVACMHAHVCACVKGMVLCACKTLEETMAHVISAQSRSLLYAQLAVSHALFGI